MKQLLFLLLFPCLALAQYPNNGNQKITLGEQTTADGLVYRGVANDTNIITPFSDTSAYIILDTIDSKFYHYNRTTTYWALAGGGGGSTLDTATMLLPYYRAGRNGIIQVADVPTLNQNTTGSAATLTAGRTIQTNLASTSAATFNGSANITPGVTGVLPLANGGTGQTTLALDGINTGSGTLNYLPKYTSTGTTLGNSLIFDNGSSVGIGTTSPTGGLQLQITGTNARIGFLNSSSASTSNYSQMAFGHGTAINEYAEFIRYNNTKRFSIFNGGGDIFFSTNYVSDYRYDLFIESDNGNVGIGTASPTARLHLSAGTASASSAPLKFTSGINLTTAEAGAMEFNGTNLFFSPSTTRHTVNHGLTGSATLDFPSTGALFAADLTITVTGASDGDVVSLGVPNASVNANTCYTAWVSAANTVTVRFNNYSSGTLNPASGTFKVFVTK
jgi:hypothetical protein